MESKPKLFVVMSGPEANEFLKQRAKEIISRKMNELATEKPLHKERHECFGSIQELLKPSLN